MEIEHQANVLPYILKGISMFLVPELWSKIEIRLWSKF